MGIFRYMTSRKNRVYGRKHLPTQPLTKITPYTLKRIAFTTSRASEMKARAIEALSINPHSEKLSQTSFGHISINSSTIPTVLMATESP